MDITQQGVTALLKSAVTSEATPLPEGFDLEAAHPQLKKHHMDAMLYDGAVRCGISRKIPVMQTLFQSYCRTLLTSENQMRELVRILAAFEENGIDHMPLKGSKMKALYPKPELRMMGDADILIRVEQYERIRPIMEGLGFAESVESDHELIWKAPGLFVELHKRLIPSYNQDFYAYFGDGWDLAVPQSGSRYTMDPEDEFIYLFTHFAKHFRDGGIGCRHMVDLWVYLRANPDLDADYIRAALEKLQLGEFYENIRRAMAAWFEDGETDEKTDLITDFIFSSGSWGQEEIKFYSQLVRKSKHHNLSFSGKLMYLWDSLFPKAKALQGKYTVLKKAPWLLPAVWMYRLVYKLLFEGEDLTDKGKQLGKITNERVEAQQQFLHYVGLDFHDA